MRDGRGLGGETGHGNDSSRSSLGRLRSNHSQLVRHRRLLDGRNERRVPMECHVHATHDRPAGAAGSSPRPTTDGGSPPSRRSSGRRSHGRRRPRRMGRSGWRRPETGCAAWVRAGEPLRSAARSRGSAACAQLTWPPRDIRARGEGTSLRIGAQGRALALGASISARGSNRGHRARRTPRSPRQPRLTSPSCARRTLECCRVVTAVHLASGDRAGHPHG